MAPASQITLHGAKSSTGNSLDVQRFQYRIPYNSSYKNSCIIIIK